MIISPIIPLWIIIPLIIGILVLLFFTSHGIKLYIRIAIVLVLFLVNLRFMTPNGEVLVFSNNLDVIFVVDTTLSMDALDYDGGKRLDAVKNDLSYIIDELGGANYAVISHDNESVIKLPFTKDSDSAKVAINTLSPPESYNARGSDITLFKDELDNILDRSIKKGNRKRVVFIIGDGEINSKTGEMSSLSSMKNKIDNGAVLGYGTLKGGTMEVETYSGSGKYEILQDRTSYPYKDALSRINEENLNIIAKDLGIDYIHMTNRSNINKKLSEINKMKLLTDSDYEYAYSDIYYYFSFCLIPLILFELVLDRRSY